MLQGTLGECLTEFFGVCLGVRLRKCFGEYLREYFEAALPQNQWRPNLTRFWLRVEKPHAPSHQVTRMFNPMVASQILYLFFQSLWPPNLTVWWLRMETPYWPSHVTFWRCSRVKNKKPYFCTSTIPMVTKLGRVVT